MKLIQKVKCFFGYHKFHSVKEDINGFPLFQLECVYCKKRKSDDDTNFAFYDLIFERDIDKKTGNPIIRIK
jgi:hypothetical protein